MKIINNKLKNELNLRTEKDYPIKGVEFIDITPLIIQKEVFKEINNLFVEEIKDKNIDYIVAPEARGFLFATGIGNDLNIGIIPVRKKGKLPPSVVEATFSYGKEYGEDNLEIPKLVNDSYKGKRIYIIDDIYATGNTIEAISTELEKLGAVVVGKGVVLNILELNNSKDIFSIIDINES